MRLDDVEKVRWQGTELEWLPLRAALGTRMVGMAAFTASRAGQMLVEPHREDAAGRGDLVGAACHGGGNEEAARVTLAEVLGRDPALRESLLADPDLGPLLAD